MAVVAFHGHRDRYGMAPSSGFDAGEEVPETRRRVRDLEFLQQAAVRQPDGNAMATRADIDADTKLQGYRVQHGALLQQT